MAGLSRKSDSLQIQERDLRLFCGLYESRIKTAEHIATLYFDGSREAAKKRLQKLKAAGFITERTRKPYEPAVHFLTRKAFTLLHGKGMLLDYPPLGMTSFERRVRVSKLTLQHELEIMDVKAAFHSSIKTSANLALRKFSTWPLLYQFEVLRTVGNRANNTMKPDGFISIHEIAITGGEFESAFFLELDRSHEIQDKLVAKAVCYLAYYRSGQFAVKNNLPPEAYKDCPFRVLMVFKTAERRNNTAERLIQNNPPILTMVYLSTLQEVVADALGPIWIRPSDYRDALKGTAFDLERRRSNTGYKRQAEREYLVEQKIRKLPLLGD